MLILRISCLFLASFCLCEAKDASFSPDLERQSSADEAFSDFIRKQTVIFKSNVSNSVQVENVPDYYTSEPYTNATFTNVVVAGIQQNEYSVATDLSNLKIRILFHTFPQVSGNYTLDGLANSQIIVKGRGPFQSNSTSSGIYWNVNATLQISSDRHVSLTSLGQWLEQYSYQAYGKFDGIDGYEIIGQNITNYLDNFASFTLPTIDSKAVNKTRADLLRFLNSALQKLTLEEIIGNATGPSTTTSTPPPIGSDYTIDDITDLMESEWTVPTTDSCAYASEITGFFCNGSPVSVREPYQGRGFWMSPCRGECTIEYRGSTLIRRLGVQAFYSDTSSSARITIKLIRGGSVIREFALLRGDGIYNEIELQGYQYDTVQVTMDNNGQAGFGILDSLRVFNGSK